MTLCFINAATIKSLLSFFDINNVFFTFMNYPMSYLEFFGTILNILSVWLITRKNIWSWPIGIVAVILFGILFYQIQLYSDLVEQGYFLVTGFYGWWLWHKEMKKGENETEEDIQVFHNSPKENIISLIIVILGTAIMGAFMCRIHIFLPALFAVPASFPYLDAFTTVMSFVAQMLMAHKKIESWYLWITVDVIGIWLYYVKGVKFVSLLYLIFLVLAIQGLYKWLNRGGKLEMRGGN